MAPILTDTFGRHHSYLRISLTERCNLRCRYCMPEQGVDLKPRDEILTFEEIERLARLFISEGVNKIRLTGGEPLVRQDVEVVVDRLGRLRSEGLDTLAITTNGLLLRKKLDRLLGAGVNLFNISLDTLVADRFTHISRRQGHGLVVAAIDELLERAAVGNDLTVKLNCVVMRGFNDDEVIDFVRLAKDRPLEVRFIEYMPFDDNGWQDGELVPYRELLDRIAEELSFVRREDGPSATSKTYQVDGHTGTFGFITSMSEDFCDGCNRLRITADGNLKVCLFGPAEVSLRDAMRAGDSDDNLRQVISEAVSRKKARHAGMYTIAETQNRPMILIGG